MFSGDLVTCQYWAKQRDQETYLTDCYEKMISVMMANVYRKEWAVRYAILLGSSTASQTCGASNVRGLQQTRADSRDSPEL